jgi:hypothetical protein
VIVQASAFEQRGKRRITPQSALELTQFFDMSPALAAQESLHLAL